MYRHTFYAVAALALILFLSACEHVQDVGDRLGLHFGEKQEPVTVTLLHMNDFHSQFDPLMPPDEPSQGGIARVKTLVDDIRLQKGEENTLLLFGGDAFQGTMFYNTWKGSAEVMALNELGFDAVALGNHEFDSGPQELIRALGGGAVTIAGMEYPTEAADFLVLATNIDATEEPALEELTVKRAIIEKNGVRYGLLGVTTETTANVSSPGERVRFLDYAATVQNEVDALTAEGINKIILMSHSGTDVDRAMIPQLSGVDVVVGGHDHALLGDAEAIRAAGLPNQAARVIAPYPDVLQDRDRNNVLLVSAFEKGRWLGNIDITFDAGGIIQDGAWDASPVFVRGCEVDRSGGVPVETDCSQQVAAPDAALQAKVEEYRQPMEALANEPIGRALVHFSGRHAAGAKVHSLGNLTADIMLAYVAGENVDAAVLNRGGMRADLAKGPVLYSDITAVLPFDNSITVVEVTGAELLEAMDVAVSQAGGKSYGAYPHVAGMSIRHCQTDDCDEPLLLGGRVTTLEVQGKPVEMRKRYRIATIDYLAKGGDFYTVFRDACAAAAQACHDKGVLLRDVVADWFRARGAIGPVSQERVVAY